MIMSTRVVEFKSASQISEVYLNSKALLFIFHEFDNLNFRPTKSGKNLEKEPLVS